MSRKSKIIDPKLVDLNKKDKSNNDEERISRTYQGFTVTRVKTLWNENRLNKPSYQRDEVWSSTQQEDLVYTILKQQHVPPLLLIEKGSDYFDINDGFQRIMSIMNFCNKEISLPTDIPEEDLRGKGIVQLEEYDKKLFTKFMDYDIGAMILKGVRNEETARTIFLRQQQGLVLTAGEKVHADFGHARDFIVNDMHEHELIKEVLNTKDDRDQKIRFCSRLFINEVKGDIPKKQFVASAYSNIKEVLKDYRREEVKQEYRNKILKIFELILEFYKKNFSENKLTQYHLLSSYIILSYKYNEIISNTHIKNQMFRFLEDFFKQVKRASDLEDNPLDILQNYKKFYEMRLAVSTNELKMKLDILLNEYERYIND